MILLFMQSQVLAVSTQITQCPDALVEQTLIPVTLAHKNALPQLPPLGRTQFLVTLPEEISKSSHPASYTHKPLWLGGSQAQAAWAEEKPIRGRRGCATSKFD